MSMWREWATARMLALATEREGKDSNAMTLKGSLLKIVSLTAAAFALAAPASQATQLEGPDFTCPELAPEKPFKQWKDRREYGLVPGGGFEDGMPLWGPFEVQTVDGNESFNVRDPQDSKSLLLPAGSFVTSKPLCIGKANRMRLFARAAEMASGARLAVDLIYEATPGTLRAVPIATLKPNTSWKATRRIRMFGKRIPLTRARTPIELRFRSVGSADWQVDDVYVDAVTS
jgi:hypothetical protein